MANEQKQNAPRQETDVASLQTKVEELSNMVSALLRAQGQVSPDTLWAKQEQKENKIRILHDEMASYNGETTERRTQLEANKIFPEGKRIYHIRLGVGGAGDAPFVYVKADTEIDSKGRYLHICGITQVRKEDRHPEWSTYTIKDVSPDSKATAEEKAAAQSAINDKWVYEQAAA